MLQAPVAAGLALSRAIVRDMVPPEEAASMIGYVTMGMALIPMVVPMLGGVLDELFGWQSIFAFTFVFGLAVTVLHLGRPRRDQPRALGEHDGAGALLSRAPALGAVLGLFGDGGARVGHLLRLPRRRAVGGDPRARPLAVGLRLLLRVHLGRLRRRQLPLGTLRDAGRARPDDARRAASSRRRASCSRSRSSRPGSSARSPSSGRSSSSGSATACCCRAPTPASSRSSRTSPARPRGSAARCSSAAARRCRCSAARCSGRGPGPGRCSS